jgi:hypothetical protein
MTPRKPTPTIVVAPEPLVFNTAQLATRLGLTAKTVTENLVFYDDRSKATAKDVPAELGGGNRSVCFNLGGGVFVEMWRRPNGAICCFRQHAEDAIAEAGRRLNHPAARGER